MKPPLHNRTAIQKAMAINGAVCILSFGLCSAGLIAANRDDRWLKLSQILFGFCGTVASVSFALTLGLYCWDQFRPKRK